MLPLLLMLGLVIGSFLNVVVLRTEGGEELTGRSHCPHCKKTLRWYELIPVASYLFQRGRCRGCRARISPQYPLVELATALTFVFVSLRVADMHGLALTSFFTESLSALMRPLAVLALSLAVWALLIVITVYDLRTKLIPNRFSFTFAAVALATTLLTPHSPLLTPHSSLLTLLAGPALYLPFWALWRVSDGRWIGLGDAKLALGMGWMLGLMGGFSAVMFAFWIGAAVSLLLIGAQRLLEHLSVRAHSPLLTSHYSLKTEIPFGPFLVVGTAIVYFTGTTFATLFF